MDSKSLATDLVAWYRTHKRALPWRDSTNPYHILVSEMMLQQTQVTTVIPFYNRFLQVFPTLMHIRRASEADLLAQWQGLGYYRRARMLHAIAKSCDAIPSSVDELKTLPGIGDYTASAIACFAFGEQCAAVDGNVKRVLSRVEAISATGTNLKRESERLMTRLIDSAPAADVNQALMDLGSSICVPKNPNCGCCPISKFCRACKSGRQSEFPHAEPRAPSKTVRQIALVSLNRGKIALRSEHEKWWKGMMHFPRIELREFETIENGLAREQVAHYEAFATIKHRITNHRIELFGVSVRTKPTNTSWYDLAKLDTVPLPAPDRKLLVLYRKSVLSHL